MLEMSRRIAIAGISLLLCAPAFAGDTHQVTKTDAKATVGQPGTASVTIQGRNGWHVNEEAPISLKLTPDPGVTLDKPKLARPDLAENTKERARFDVKFTASEPGTKAIAAEASFVMCQASACQPVKEKLTLALDVAAPAAKPPAPPAAKPAKKRGH